MLFLIKNFKNTRKMFSVITLINFINFNEETKHVYPEYYILELT